MELYSTVKIDIWRGLSLVQAGHSTIMNISCNSCAWNGKIVLKFSFVFRVSWLAIICHVDFLRLQAVKMFGLYCYYSSTIIIPWCATTLTTRPPVSGSDTTTTIFLLCAGKLYIRGRTTTSQCHQRKSPNLDHPRSPAEVLSNHQRTMPTVFSKAFPLYTHGSRHRLWYGQQSWGSRGMAQ